MSEPTYSFHPVTAADLPLLRRWLEAPAVREWWGDPDHEIGLIREDLAEDRMVNLIVQLAGKPFAYVQHYDVNDWPQAHLTHLPAGSRAIDTFIGDETMLGGGHASSYLRQLALALLRQGAPEVVIDPETSNGRARRAFERAGFIHSEWHGPTGETALVMRFDSNQT